MQTPEALSRFLGARALQVIQAIDEPSLQEHVLVALQVCADTLAAVDALDLSAYEMTPEGSDELGLWREVGPRVQNLLWVVGDAADRLRMLFPGRDHASAETPAVDLDAAFDLLQSGEDAESIQPIQPIRDHRALEIDLIVQRVNTDRQEILGDAITSLASMLQEDFSRFGQRLKNPNVLRDKWVLLGELQELQSKCSECLEAIVATLLQAFADDEITDILPRYTDAALRAAKLRSAVVDFAHDVRRVQEAITNLDRDRARVFHDYLVQRMDHFVGLPAYRYLRPSDKKEFILFRIFLFTWGESDKGVQTLRDQVEGFSKFLDMMRAINNRRELLSHDRRYLAAVVTVLQSNLGTNRARPYLEMVYGRSERLDQMVRLCREAYPVDRKSLEAIVKEIFHEVNRAAPF